MWGELDALNPYRTALNKVMASADCRCVECGSTALRGLRVVSRADGQMKKYDMHVDIEQHPYNYTIICSNCEYSGGPGIPPDTRGRLSRWIDRLADWLAS